MYVVFRILIFIVVFIFIAKLRKKKKSSNTKKFQPKAYGSNNSGKSNSIFGSVNEFVKMMEGSTLKMEQNELDKKPEVLKPVVVQKDDDEINHNFHYDEQSTIKKHLENPTQSLTHTHNLASKEFHFYDNLHSEHRNVIREIIKDKKKLRSAFIFKEVFGRKEF